MSRPQDRPGRGQIEDLYPLSPMQRGMLFHALYDADAPIYFEQVSYRLRGRLNLPAFENAWQRVVDRHPILRTSFHYVGLDEPLQMVRRQAKLPLFVEDLTQLEPALQEARLEAFQIEDRRRGFKLDKAPLLRLAVFQLDHETHHVVWSHHHLLLDGWSVSLAVREVLAFYDRLARGEDLRLERPRPYRDYIAWLGKQDLAAAESFWRQTLKGFSAPTPFGVDRSIGQPAEHSGDHRTLQTQLSDSATEALGSFARQHLLTTNTVVQAAWASLLSRYSGEEDVVFGSTVSGRPSELAGVDTMVGLFINVVPVRVKARREQSVLSLLHELQAQQREAREYEHTPLADIQRWSDVPAGSPLFETLLTFENYPLDQRVGQPADLEIAAASSFERTNYPLTVMAVPGRPLSLRVGYDQGCFDGATIERLLGHFKSLLEGIVANPLRSVQELPLLAETEQHQLLVEWNATEVALPASPVIHERFEAQAAATPDAIAVIVEDQQLTYRALNARANQLARALRTAGVGPDGLVGLFMERSLELVVGMLAVLKAGGAYLPLDPGYPAERLRFMLDDSQAAVVLTQDRLRAQLPPTAAVCLSVDAEWAALSRGSDQNPVHAVSLENLAYVIYTSGSTGRPKGAMLGHGAIANHMNWMGREFPLTPGDAVLQKTPISFDASVWEFYAPLLAGARLVLARPGGHQDAGYLRDTLARYGITTLQVVPSLLRLLLEQGDLARASGLRRLFCGGEALTSELRDRFFQAVEAELHNLYGPTETCIESLAWSCDRDRSRATVPIGRPIDNTRVYLLDGAQRPTPIGVPGELHIAGLGVGRGYVNRPDLTAERYLPQPFAGPAGARVYRTGDLARYRPEGPIEYLGRRDHQAKVRGFRIELGEIEAVLRQHPAVATAVVLVREDIPGDRRLVAYLTTASEPAPTVVELRSYLRADLPDYMVPAVFITLEALPLTPNGKIDRKALPAPDQTRPDLEHEFVPPRNEGERVLTEIWSQVLRVTQVGVHDNFFELGGDSILSIQIVSKANQAGLRVTPKDIFEHPTIASLALTADSSVPQPQAADATTPLEFQLAGLDRATLAKALGDERHVADAYPLSPIQQGLLFHSLLERTSKTYFVQLRIVIRGDLRVPDFHRAWQQVVDRHPVLRTSFHHQELPRPLQVVEQQVDIPFEQQDWRELATDKQNARLRSFLAADRQKGFELSRAPLMRLTLLQTSDDTYEFIWSYHHLLLDGWSVPLILKDVLACYEAAMNGKEHQLEHRRPYRDYIAWLGEQEFSTAKAYWQQALRGFATPTPPGIEVGTRRRAEHTSINEDRSIELSTSSTEALRSFGRRHHLTLNTLLQGAWAIQLSRYCGEPDVLFGATLSGRSIPLASVDSMVGIFINTLPVRVRVSEEKPVLTFLRELQADHVEARRFEYTPLVELQRWSDVPAGVPLFESVMVVENYPVDEALRRQSADLEFKLADLDVSEFTNYPVTVLAAPGRQLSLRMACDSGRFDGATVERMLGHFKRLLEEMVSDSERLVSELTMLSESEQRQLVQWNETDAAYSQDKTIHALFERQVQKTPDGIAVVFDKEQLTYRELDARANHLAAHLRELGVGPEVVVGLCMERSVEMMVGLLGILKAGGAYMPLSPDDPRERLGYFLDDAAVALLLTQSRLLERLPHTTRTTLCLDSDWDEIVATPGCRPPRAVVPENAAYVIYTSGSTGRPKGVVNTHDGISNRLQWMQDAYGLDTNDRVLQKTPATFDVSVWEFFWPIMTGAAVVLAQPGGHRDPAYLMRTIRNERITTLHFVPSMLQAFLDGVSGEPACVPLLRRVMCSGEELTQALKERFLSQFESVQLYNLYGPTEAAVDVTAAVCVHGEAIGSVPIGRPVANTQIYVLDSAFHPTPVGVGGELHIGGIQVARAYLNRSGLTAERFIPDPFGHRPGGRLYRTGDRSRYLADGHLEFQGRLDYQVKIRGFRIELGEIEAALTDHPSVREAVVLARQDGPADSSSVRQTDKRLVAYLVVERQPGPETAELRSYLKERLPDYMVPAVFVTLDSLPLTPNGKLDRKALPVPGQTAPALEQAFVEPRTRTEETVASIWQDLLRVDKIGVHHDFFELGGHSLIATQLVSRVRQAFGIELPLDEVFKASTVAAFAERIDNASWALEGLQLPAGRVGSDLEEGEI
jgi:amino acid adenylation domain-containing protein